MPTRESGSMSWGDAAEEWLRSQNSQPASAARPELGTSAPGDTLLARFSNLSRSETRRALYHELAEHLSFVSGRLRSCIAEGAPIPGVKTESIVDGAERVETLIDTEETGRVDPRITAIHFEHDTKARALSAQLGISADYYLKVYGLDTTDLKISTHGAFIHQVVYIQDLGTGIFHKLTAVPLGVFPGEEKFGSGPGYKLIRFPVEEEDIRLFTRCISHIYSLV